MRRIFGSNGENLTRIPLVVEEAAISAFHDIILLVDRAQGIGALGSPMKSGEDYRRSSENAGH
jgi:hypothetical protein